MAGIREIAGAFRPETRMPGNPAASWWCLRRLASMEPREVVARALKVARLPLDWRKYRFPEKHTKAISLDAVPRPYPVSGVASSPPAENFRIFDLSFPHDVRFDWQRDYKNQIRAPKTFAPLLDVRNPHEVGDIKYIWEINRHQYLCSLAYGGPEERLAHVVASLDGWLKENPYLCGVNWTSSLELGLRVISWSLLYPRIAERSTTNGDFMDRWMDSLYLHLQRIHQHQSRFSSANNHLIGEMAGLYIGAVCFPLWRESLTWAAEARESLEREIQKQVSSDGVNREQAISYHLFTLELLLLAYAIGKNLGEPFSDKYEARLRAMLNFLDVVATPAGELPWYGDSDDARGFLFCEQESSLAVVTQLGAFLFDEPSLLRFSTDLTTAAKALIPNACWEPGGPPSPGVNLFRDGGFAAADTYDGKHKLIMDFGCLGYTSIAAHGHADALAIWFAVDGEYFIVDCGTYAYHSHPEWRDFFRGTAAHNTARIDGRNQSIIGGRFLWSRKANTRLVHSDCSGHTLALEAEQDGYLQLADPVIHRRAVMFDRRDGHVEIRDTFSCRKRHKIELYFHLHEDTSIHRIEPGLAEAVWRRRHIVFDSPQVSFHWDVVCGGERPEILGWRSRGFGRKQPIPTLRISASVYGTTTIQTNINIEE
jgi:hypothetical protein